MWIRLENPTLMPALLAFLERVDCAVDQRGPNTLETSIAGAMNDVQASLELRLYLSAWHALHPEGDARLVG